MSKLRDNQALCDEIRASCSILKPGATVPIDRAVTRILDAVDRHLAQGVPASELRCPGCDHLCAAHAADGSGCLRVCAELETCPCTLSMAGGVATSEPAALPGHLQGEAATCARCGKRWTVCLCEVTGGGAPASAPTVPDLVQTACGPVHRDNIGRPPSIPAPTAVTACEPAQLICGHCGEASIDHMGAGNDCAGGETTFETATDFNQALRRASATADISEGGVGPHDWRPYPGMGWECRCGWLRRVARAGELSTSFEYRPLGKRVWQPVEPSCSGTGRSPGGAGK